MTRDEHLDKLYEFIKKGDTNTKLSKEFCVDLSEALYSCNERNMFGDSHISWDDAMHVYHLIMALKNNRFPEELKM